MRAERGSGGEVGPLKATVAPPASTTEQDHEVMRPPSEITWPEVSDSRDRRSKLQSGCGIWMLPCVD